MAIVYKTTNLVNGKIYIGAYGGKDETYYGSGTLLKKAISRYGKKNFKRDVLFQFDTLEEAYTKEAEIVNKDFIKREDVYNLQTGGNGGRFRIVSEDTKRKIRESKENITDETRLKMSESAKARMERDGSPTAGIERSSETKQKISDNRKASGVAKGENNPMYGKSRADVAARNKMRKRWMHKDGVTKQVLLANVEEMQSQGYEFGRPS